MYIPQFATLVEPLTLTPLDNKGSCWILLDFYCSVIMVRELGLRALLHNDEKFVCSQTTQQSFEALKSIMVQSPTLAMYDPDSLTTDASVYGLGAVLTQVKNSKEVTVECASRTLSSAEINYSVGEKEALIRNLILTFGVGNLSYVQTIRHL